MTEPTLCYNQNPVVANENVLLLLGDDILIFGLLLHMKYAVLVWMRLFSWKQLRSSHTPGKETRIPYNLQFSIQKFISLKDTLAKGHLSNKTEWFGNKYYECL